MFDLFDLNSLAPAAGGNTAVTSAVDSNCSTDYLIVSSNLVVAAVAQSVEPPELRSLKELQLSDISLNPGCSMRL